MEEKPLKTYEVKYTDGTSGYWYRYTKSVVYQDNRRNLQFFSWNQIVQNMTLEIPKSGTPIMGEIIGWRVWIINRKYLMSLYKNYLWYPKTIAEALVDETSSGIYCFRSINDALTELHRLEGYNAFAFVLGSIEIWGDIVECHKGYRAQFANIVSLDEIRIVRPGLRNWIRHPIRSLRFTKHTSNPRSVLNYFRSRYLNED